MHTIQLHDFEQTSPDGFTKRMIRETPHALVFMLNFEAGQTLPAHTHGESDVLLTVLAGEGEVTVDGRAERVRPGLAVHCEGKESLSARNTGTAPLSLLVFLYPGQARFAGNVR